MAWDLLPLRANTMKRSVKRFSVLAALLAFGLAACDVAQAGMNGGALPGAEGNVDFALVPQELVAEGRNDFSMTLVDVHSQKLLSGAMVTLRTTMPAMGHETVEGTVEEPNPGLYVLRGVVFDMP